MSPVPQLAPPPTDFIAKSIDLPHLEVNDFLTNRAEVEAMVADGMAWSAMHGLLVHESRLEEDEEGGAPRLIHAPFTLLPTSFPEEQLRDANEKLAPLFGLLVERVSRDVPWLAQTLREAAAGDDFTRRLLKLCAQVQREGTTQPARLAILRSDYMLHEPEGSTVGSARLLQVELNTIAASFASLGSLVGELHTRLAQRWPSARRHAWLEAGQPSVLKLPETLPPSRAVEELAAAMARAHEIYGAPVCAAAARRAAPAHPPSHASSRGIPTRRTPPSSSSFSRTRPTSSISSSSPTACGTRTPFASCGERSLTLHTKPG